MVFLIIVSSVVVAAFAIKELLEEVVKNQTCEMDHFEASESCSP